MAALAEEACDAVVLAHGHNPRLSECLIDMARSVSSSGARIQVWGVAMPGGFLEERIRRILEGARCRGYRARAWCVPGSLARLPPPRLPPALSIATALP